jgi:hypothetical protein
MARTIDFVVYCPREFTAVIVVFALETIGAFRSSSPPSAHSLTLLYERKRYAKGIRRLERGDEARR